MKKKHLLKAIPVLLLSVTAFALSACKTTKTSDDPFSSPSVSVDNPSVTGDKMPTILGVEDQKTYYEGTDSIAPTFDVGMATLKKDDGEPKTFVSGTAITEKGTYVLVVTNGNQSTTITFTIAEYYETYAGEMTDYFDNTRLHKDYITDANSEVSLQNGVLYFQNKPDGDPWGILKRKFEKVNATKNPYLEIKVDKLGDGPGNRLEIALLTDEWGIDVTIETITYSGTYYINVLDYVKKNQLDEQEADLYLKMAIVGKTAGFASAQIDYFRSVATIPAAVKAERYVDNTAETLSAWRADTASLKYINQKGTAYVSAPNDNENYGKAVKRVSLNTKDYPILAIDIDSISGEAAWSLKYQIAGGDENLIYDGHSDTGIKYVDLTKCVGLEANESIAVNLYFYVIGIGDNDIVHINGFSQLTREEMPVISYPGEDGMTMVEEFYSTEPWNAQSITATALDEGGTKLSTTNDDATYSRYLTMTTTQYDYLMVDLTIPSDETDLDSAFYIEILDDISWIEKKVQATTAGFTSIRTVNEDDSISYQIYIDLTDAVKLSDNSKETLTGKERFDFKVSFKWLSADKVVILNSISLAEELPTELKPEEEQQIIDRFKTNWTNKGYDEVSYGDDGVTIHTGTSSTGSLEKQIVFTTTTYSIIKFTVLVPEEIGDLDDAFYISILDNVNWIQAQVQFDGDNWHATNVTEEDGSKRYEIYVDLQQAVKLSDQSESTLSNLSNVGLVVEIKWLSTDKIFSVLQMEYAEELPA